MNWTRAAIILPIQAASTRSSKNADRAGIPKSQRVMSESETKKMELSVAMLSAPQMKFTQDLAQLLMSMNFLSKQSSKDNLSSSTRTSQNDNKLGIPKTQSIKSVPFSHALHFHMGPIWQNAWMKQHNRFRLSQAANLPNSLCSQMQIFPNKEKDICPQTSTNLKTLSSLSLSRL